MAVKNPDTAEWLSRNLDVAAGFGTGLMEKKPAEKGQYSIWATVPPYLDISKDVVDWNKYVCESIERLGGKELSAVNVVDGDDRTKRRQFEIRGAGGWREFEGRILDNFDTTLGAMLPENVRKGWRMQLESTRPTAVTHPTPMECATALKRYLAPHAENSAVANIISILDHTINEDPYDIQLSGKLEAHKAEVSAIFADNREIVNAYQNTLMDLATHKNNMAVKTELWLERAFTPLAMPYMGIIMDNSEQGKSEPEKFEMEMFCRKVMAKVFSDDFAKGPRLQMEKSSVLTAKAFRVQPYYIRAGAPKVLKNADGSVSVKFNWLQPRMHWKLQQDFIKTLMDCSSINPQFVSSKDQKKNKDEQYADPYGLNGLFSQTLTVSPNGGKEEQKKLWYQVYGLTEAVFGHVDSLKPTFANTPDCAEYMSKQAAKIRAGADLVSTKLKKEREKKEAQQNEMVVENRVMPMPNRSSVYIQYVFGNGKPGLFPELNQAVNEACEKYPGWKVNKVWDNDMYKYTAAYLIAPNTGEGAGVIARAMVARFIEERAAELAGRSVVEYQSPNTGYTVEAGLRRVNPTNRNDLSECVYVKMPAPIKPGGKIAKKLMMAKQKTLAEFNAVDKGAAALYTFEQSFGENSPHDSLLKLFVPATSPNEHYTKTYKYDLDADPETAKEECESIKEALESRIGELFKDTGATVNLDWMPDSAARKLEDGNRKISYYLKQWCDSVKERTTAEREQEKAEEADDREM